MEQQALQWLGTYSYPAVVLLLVGTGIGLPVSEELVMLGAGLLVAQGQGRLVPMVLASWLGLLMADLLLYRIGRGLGTGSRSNAWLGRMLTPARTEWARAHFAKHGALTVAAARFLPGVRAPTFVIAGASGLPMSTFLAIDAVAGTVWAATLVYLGYRFGPVALADVSLALRWATGVVAAVAGVALLRRWLRRARQGARRQTPAMGPVETQTGGAATVAKR